MTDRRPIRYFLTNEGLFTVSVAVPATNVLYCDCGVAEASTRRLECRHIRSIRKRIARGTGLPLEFDKKLPPKELRALLDGPLDEYKRFFVRHGAIEVL